MAKQGRESVWSALVTGGLFNGAACALFARAADVVGPDAAVVSSIIRVAMWVSFGAAVAIMPLALARARAKTTAKHGGE